MYFTVGDSHVINGFRVLTKEGYFNSRMDNARHKGQYIINRSICRYGLHFISDDGKCKLKIGNYFWFNHAKKAIIESQKVKPPLPHGSIIYRRCSGFNHFGIYDKVGHKVIEYDTHGLNSDLGIRENPLSSWQSKAESDIFVLDVKSKYSNQQVVERARSLLGRENFSLLFRNCEHFAMWARTGLWKSRQIVTWRNTLIISFPFFSIATYWLVNYVDLPEPDDRPHEVFF
mmetsp:Transcript_30803/g.34358  ORF Transcript_30803/g.34358 Transcript_30803/m.34358 type:complete len:230 (-) Transcript_30803:100-789(-)